MDVSLTSRAFSELVRSVNVFTVGFRVVVTSAPLAATPSVPLMPVPFASTCVFALAARLRSPPFSALSLPRSPT